jgi:hypothetical protein
MPTERRPETISGVESDARRLTLEVEGGGNGDVIAGRMSDETGASVPFQGWLGLASALEHLLTPGLLTPGPNPSQPPVES